MTDGKKISWSDVNLYRSAANILMTDDRMTSVIDAYPQFLAHPSASGHAYFQAESEADGMEAGVILKRTGGGSHDTTWEFRLGANEKDLEWYSSELGAVAMELTSAGQLELPVQGSGGGILIGGDTTLQRVAAGVLRISGALEKLEFHTDTNIYRGGANILETDDAFHVGDYLKIFGASGLIIGADTNLYRSAANVLRTDDDFQVANSIRIDGVALYFGSLADTNLYRSAANILKTDDQFHMAGAFFRILNDSASIYLGAASDVVLYRGGADLLMTDDDFRIADGKELQWSDVNLYRGAANRLDTDDVFRPIEIFFAPTGVTDPLITVATANQGDIGTNLSHLNASYINNYNARHIPTVSPKDKEKALDKLIKIGKPRFSKAEYGSRYSFEPDQLPEEMIYTAKDGSKHAEIHRICGFLLQTVIELKEEIEELKK